ncbi:M14 family metallopeptidase [Lacinutrix salivirga]
MLNTIPNSLYNVFKESALFGRYIHNKSIEPLLNKLSKSCLVTVAGHSVNSQPIYTIKIGTGKKRVLLWSQMHGNESTTTKALFDFLNLLTSNNDEATPILEAFTFLIIPILNPDGAEAYTRLNANGIDLNRDAQDLTQPESKVLRACFNAFKPQYCFNLHGQRTIFAAGATNKPATLSFLSPSQDQHNSLTPNRKVAMAIITHINTQLQQEIPEQVGVYDDSFNINCVGDSFQQKGIPTLLFEAGHYKNDYNREETRRLVFKSYLYACNAIIKDEELESNYASYASIPENKKLFFDIIIRNAKTKEGSKDIAIQFEERLIEKTIQFIPKIEAIKNLSEYYAHKTIEASNNAVLTLQNTEVEVGYENDVVVIDNKEFSLKASEF